MIYLASPYSHPDPLVRQVRFEKIVSYAIFCMEKGEVVFSPIAYGHQFISRIGTCHETWLHFNETVLLTCEEIRIVKLPGWESSLGIKTEIAYAERHMLQLTEVTP